jgi:hypothetical protein
MSFKSAVILIAGILLGLPLVTYFTIWWGVSAYHRAKYYAEKDCKKREMPQ